VAIVLMEYQHSFSAVLMPGAPARAA